MRCFFFDFLYEYKLFMDMGYFVFVMMEEVLFGDMFIGFINLFVCVVLLVNLVMYNVEICVYYWYVFNRFLMVDWEDMIMVKLEIVEVLYLIIDIVENLELVDYFGMYLEVGNEVIVLLFCVYNMIWNEFYCD